jgi:hypothetical protein
MSLKHKNPPNPPETKSVSPDAWNGPWGRINPASETFDVIRFCQGGPGRGQTTHSYPIRVISSWHWEEGHGDEQLRINAGADLIVVKGRGLERIVEALDRGTLELLREESDLIDEQNRSISISRIEIESQFGE